MKSRTIGALGALALTASFFAAATTAEAAKPGSGTTTIQLLTVSDWHGQIVPLQPATGPVGGAAYLKAYFDQARAQNPNTLTFMAGDSVGATPPISSFFDDVPAIESMNLMGISADTFGNHNFDHGIAHLQDLIDIADFPFVAANLKNLADNLSGVEKRATFTVDGVKVAVIGIVNEEVPTLVTPGGLGTLQITSSVPAANKAAAQARAGGAKVVVILTHKGIRGYDGDGNAFGELIDFADGIDPSLIDVVVGDHTDFQYSGLHHGILAVENLSKGATFANIQLSVDKQTGVTAKSVSFTAPVNAGITPDPTIQAYLDSLTLQLAPILGVVIGSSNVPVSRADSCGQSAGRTCESLVGDIVTDAMRTAYGTDFAITNSGGLRAALTCPLAGSGGFCPSGAVTPPYPITRGSVIGVLPFGNESTTVTISGTELKGFLEVGVSTMPAVNGKFAQVSGLCFSYDISAPVGSRVVSAVRQAADGSCTGAPIDLTAASTYTLTTNDFMAAGGDGYPDVNLRATSRDLMAQDLEDYVAASSPISPAIQGRIVCTSSGATACPVTTP
jgi:2',3'-cyclic-nucleotide 2'-phosphodiesterase (5'-nucleotidase family)